MCSKKSLSNLFYYSACFARHFHYLWVPIVKFPVHGIPNLKSFVFFTFPWKKETELMPFYLLLYKNSKRTASVNAQKNQFESNLRDNSFLSRRLLGVGNKSPQFGTVAVYLLRQIFTFREKGLVRSTWTSPYMHKLTSLFVNFYPCACVLRLRETYSSSSGDFLMN